MKKTGIVDEPIKPFLKGETGQDDRLGINDYAQALQTFIENTDTPMTVGIQGEWGSGKTSLMNKLWKELEGTEKNTRYESIWINTWEHSLLKSPEEALVSIINEITRQVSLLNPKSDKAKKISHVVNEGDLVITKPNVAHAMVFTKDSIFLNLVRGER